MRVIWADASRAGCHIPLVLPCAPPSRWAGQSVWTNRSAGASFQHGLAGPTDAKTYLGGTISRAFARVTEYVLKTRFFSNSCTEFFYVGLISFLHLILWLKSRKTTCHHDLFWTQYSKETKSILGKHQQSLTSLPHLFQKPAKALGRVAGGRVRGVDYGKGGEGRWSSEAYH